MFFHVILGCQVHLAKCSNYLLWQLLNKALGVCLFSYLCCRCLRSWSGRLQMRAGLFLGGTQTSPDSMTRCVSVRFLYTFGNARLRESIVCGKSPASLKPYFVIICPCLQTLFVTINLLLSACLPLFLSALWK